MARIQLPDLDASQVLGQRIAEVLRPDDIVTLSGGLGMGKTSIARAIIAAIGFSGEVASPSFAIVEEYLPPETSIPLCHLDLYRIEDEDELEELGLEQLGSGMAALIEWPEHAGGWLSRFDDNVLAIRLEAAANGRTAFCDWGSNWKNRILWT